MFGNPITLKRRSFGNLTASVETPLRLTTELLPVSENLCREWRSFPREQSRYRPICALRCKMKEVILQDLREEYDFEKAIDLSWLLGETCKLEGS
jgi:endogenous inhibitor of DNA gyrase (YacG/DUF329 family)